jgi:hypothetical protein
MARNYKRDRKGRFARVGSIRKSIGNPAVVPYGRTSTRSQTIGVNAGANVGKKVRVSTGGYIRVERRGRTNLEKKIRAKDEVFINKVSGKLSPHPMTNGIVKGAIIKGRQAAVNKFLGGQKDVAGGKASVRLTTSQQLMPTVSYRKGRSKVSAKKRRKGVDDYNRAVSKLKSNQIKQPRPQRRNAGKKVA